MEFPRLIRVFLALASIALAGSTLAQSRFTFDIPAQPASEAIRALARQSGLQVAALTDDLSGIRTNAVRGVYAPMEALKLLIKDTGLQIDVTEANSVTIHRDPNNPALQRGGRSPRVPPA
jgi:hypothetical protein